MLIYVKQIRSFSTIKILRFKKNFCGFHSRYATVLSFMTKCFHRTAFIKNFIINAAINYFFDFLFCCSFRLTYFALFNIIIEH